MALNSFTSNEIMLDFSKELYELFFDKVDGIIVANISIAMMLKKRNYKEIIISNLFGTYSNDAVDFLVKQFDPIKIILPRDISLKNIQTIVKSHPNIMFECFLFGDNCRFSESFCFSEHGYDSLTFGSLCSYTQREKKLIKNANPSYKQIVKNTKLTDTEKKEELKKVFLDITSLLDEIEFNLYEFNSKEITLILETLSLYDIAMLKEDKKIYVRAINILKNLDFPKAQSIYTKLKELPFIQEDNYKKFHKLNKSAIYETLNFFAQFNNITSYKIPSRGRDFYKYLDTFENEEYHYKQSQYQL
ncbi:MAG: U32 family peptidase [Candidatus Marinarcus sp.]|uniref:U32 family peptidase n=1 Tax=Candidatus Marinarcus sp. TaxID=3100987 RepID=UPI003B00567E